MPLQCKFDVKQEHITCEVSGQYTVGENARIFQLIVERCAAEGINRAIVDCTGVEQSVMVTLKLIGAHNVMELAHVMTKKGIPIPKIALYGVAPLIGQFKPASDLYKRHGLPFRVFDDLPAAKEWLLSTD
jgi:hypothetical protein